MQLTDLKLLANPFGTKINTSSNISVVLVYLCDVPNGLANNFNLSDDPMSVPVSRSSCVRGVVVATVTIMP